MEEKPLISDPSSLTLQMIEREIQHLHQLTFNRFDSIQRAIDLEHENVTRFPTDVQKQVGALKELVYSKIEDINEKFGMLEKERLEQKQDTALNVEKAFNSAKEAVKEQNNNNNIAISKTEMYVNAQLNSLMSTINDLKERVTKTEGVTAGISSTKTEQKTSIGLIAAIIFGLLGFVCSVIGIMIMLNR